MITDEKIREYVKNWMERHEPDTFIPNQHNQMIYKSECGVSGLNLELFFVDLLQDFRDDIKIAIDEIL